MILDTSQMNHYNLIKLRKDYNVNTVLIITLYSRFHPIYFISICQDLYFGFLFPPYSSCVSFPYYDCWLLPIFLLYPGVL